MNQDFTLLDDSQEQRHRPFANWGPYKILKRRFEQAERSGAVPIFYLPHETVNSAQTEYNGTRFDNYAAYNYLGLSGDERVSEAAKQAIDQYGTSVSASRIVAGEIPLHKALEQALATWIGTEDCIVYISGYGTNVDIIGHLLTRHDLVIHDSLAHNSIMTGARMSQAKRLNFQHNDWQQLEDILSEHRANHRQCLLVLEGVYSMDGDIPDLHRVIALKKKYDFLLMVDEAHSLGTIGKSGRGVTEVFGLDPNDIDIHMGTLSKSFAAAGGFIAGDSELIQTLRYTAPGFLFSVGLSPADTAAALEALHIVQQEPQRIRRIQSNAKLFENLAREAGLDISLAMDTPIIPVVLGHTHTCIHAAQFLLDRGVLVHSVVYPAVAEGQARLRFFISSEHTETQIRNTVALLIDAIEYAQAQGQRSE